MKVVEFKTDTKLKAVRLPTQRFGAAKVDQGMVYLPWSLILIYQTVLLQLKRRYKTTYSYYRNLYPIVNLSMQVESAYLMKSHVLLSNWA